MGISTGAALLIATAVSVGAGAATASSNRQSQRRIAARRNALTVALEDQRRRTTIASQKEQQRANETQARVAKAEGERLRGLQLDAKGIQRRDESPDTFARQTERVLADRRN